MTSVAGNGRVSDHIVKLTSTTEKDSIRYLTGEMDEIFMTNSIKVNSEK
jgi:hypothetical protein